jgi:riboflavin kinase/FMN adenylyltransferase
LREGEVNVASDMLGRSFSIECSVVHGDGLGRKLGFPTANLDIQNNQLIPKNGIYATWAKVDGQFYKSATSIGVRPTFGPGQLQVETFLLDFEGDLYGKTLILEFQSYVREEIAFPSQSSLVVQMNKDVDRVRILLSDYEREK